MLDQRRLPVVEAIKAYRGVDRIHMPGHKGGVGVASQYLELVGTGAFEADVVGVEGLDDFHSPTGCIAEAQELAAEAWGVDHTFFLVNGTSTGLHSLVLALCRAGDRLIIPRNVHRSIVGGLILSGAVPVYVQPEFDEASGVLLGVSAGAVGRAIERHPDARGVLVVSPTYYGVISDIKSIAEIAHSHGLPLIVDEAHGAHLGFHPDLPRPSVQMGADAAAQGVHKTAGSFSQGAMLHLKGDRVQLKKVRQYLRLLQTTSPSYLLLSSLDAARFVLANEGRSRLSDVIGFGRRIAGTVAALSHEGYGVRLLEFAPGHSFCSDPTRVVINLRGTGLSGYFVERTLRHDFGVQIELSDSENIVLLLSMGDTSEAISHFTTAFETVVRAGPGFPRADGVKACSLPPIPEMVLEPAVAFARPARLVPFDEAENHISGDMIAAYPPGIPVIYPGERLTQAVMDYLREAKSAGIHVQGPLDATLEFLTVL